MNPGKPINVAQLASEMTAAGQPSAIIVYGRETSPTALYVPNANGAPVEPSAPQVTVVNAHVARRYVTDAEYATEFQNPTTTPTRKQEIRDITSGLLPRETVLMT